MKNSLIVIFSLLSLLISKALLAESFTIEAKKISVDKKSQISVFEDEVLVKTNDGKTFKSDYAEYNKSSNLIILKKNVFAKDSKNNKIITEFAEYNGLTRLFISKGITRIITSENYKLDGQDIEYDSNLQKIRSEKKTTILDEEKNKIFLENFEFNITDNIFSSIGLIKVQDKQNNTYEFTQIYIDTKKKEILGTDIKAYLNQENFKVKKENKPRIFSNTVQLNKNESKFGKSVFTLCNYRADDKCPPWTFQAKEMLHDKSKKTIFYENAIIKIYDIPIFFSPYLAHPDPSVKRRSGFLPPSFIHTKNLGSGLNVPYFFALNNDKDFTFTNKFYANENPLHLLEYRQAFLNSNLILDFGFTEGYKKTSSTKKRGEKSHFFSKFTKTFRGKDNSSNSLSLQTQDTSNDKYLKLYKIKSNLVDFNQNILENTLSFTHEKQDLLLGFKASIFETMLEDYNDKYEYILPEITIDKNIFSDSKFGVMDLQSNFKIENYDTNNTTKFFVNDLNWDIFRKNYNSGIKAKLFGTLKNVNYDNKNVQGFKPDTTSELFGAIGYLSEVDLYKNINNNRRHLFNPKLMLRYAPGHMRKDDSGSRLDTLKVFNLNRLDNINNFENGLSATIGFNYEIKDKISDKNFKLSVGQVIKPEENKDMPSVTSLDDKLSDLAGSAKLKINKNAEFDFNFLLDQNYKDLNYSEIGINLGSDLISFDLAYLQESKHVGNEEYATAKINFGKSDKSLLSIETKRNLLNNSAEYYDLSYEYINDCLRAGLIYRREFYNDSELEPENSLMFKVTLIPFGNISTPVINK